MQLCELCFCCVKAIPLSVDSATWQFSLYQIIRWLKYIWAGYWFWFFFFSLKSTRLLMKSCIVTFLHSVNMYSDGKNWGWRYVIRLADDPFRIFTEAYLLMKLCCNICLWYWSVISTWKLCCLFDVFKKNYLMIHNLNLVWIFTIMFS